MATRPDRPSLEVAVCTVTHDSAADLDGWLEGLERLDPGPRRVVVVDCASSDDTVARLERLRRQSSLELDVVPLAENLGFAGGMNRALARSNEPFVLLLNPDARPADDFLLRLVESARSGPRIAAVAGRLVRPATEGEPARLDACGMRLTPSWRHFDRGSGEIDRGQFGHAAEVFGATGAASLFLRSALDDVAVDGAIFDPRFHTFREDAELAFRLRERGWRCLYEPAARCEHRRSNLPERRRRMSPEINRHTLKNRYLLRLYHQTTGNFLLTLVPAVGRDLGILLYVLLRERSSLGAYRWLWRRRHELLEQRRKIQARRSEPAHRLDRWFLRAEGPA